MKNIQDVMKQMRRFSDDGHYADETLIEEWVSSFEAAMREKDARIETLRKLWRTTMSANEHQNAEIGRLREDNARLRGMADEFRALMVKVDQLDEKDAEIEFLTRRLDEKEKELEAAERAWRNRGNEIERVKEILSDCVTRMKRTRTILQGEYIDKGWSQERINLHANWGILDTTEEEAVLTEREKKS